MTDEDRVPRFSWASQQEIVHAAQKDGFYQELLLERLRSLAVSAFGENLQAGRHFDSSST